VADNQIIIMGNLVRDPELRYTTSGKAICNLSIAQNRRFMQNNEWVDGPTNFFNVTVWDTIGENIAASLVKGDRVVAVGRLDFRTYENKEGVEVRTHDLIADEVCPSLKWATCEMTRTRKGGSDSQPNQPRQSSGSRPADPVYGDEEPFVSLYTGHQSYRNLHMEAGF
jgi:single-strand DNA-binding protein